MPEINWTLAPNYRDARYRTLLWTEESGNAHLTVYRDSRNVATVGVGVALKEPDNLAAAIDFVDPTGFLKANYLAELTAAGKRPYGSTQAAESAFNAIMAKANAASGGTVPMRFELKNEGQARALFDYLMDTKPNNYEAVLAGRLGTVALGDTREHAALIDMTWNAHTLIGANLREHIRNGDRAEAWYEIRYESMGNPKPADENGLAKRRYMEAQVFGLYSDSKSVTDIEAKLAVRMADENAEKIKEYDGKFIGRPGVVSDGNFKISSIAAATGFKLDPIYTSIKQAIQPAVDKLIKTYVDMDGDLKVVQDALRKAEYEGNLLDPNVKEAHVASTGGSGTTQSSGLADYSSAKGNLLIMGAPSKDEVGDGGYDTRLKGGAGDDWFVGGFGKDDIDGGGGSNTVSYLDSKFSVTIDLKSGTASGGDAEGDRLKNIENIFGSRKADKITGSDEDDVVYGGGGADTIDGGAGDDVIVLGGKDDGAGGKLDGGAGDDVVVGGGGADTIEGGTGKDKLDGGAGADTIRGGGGEDEIKGGGGADELWGGDGSTEDTDADTFSGGEGSDVFHAGDGDVVKDPEPGDRLYIDDTATAGVAKRAEGSTGAYFRENVKYEWQGGALVITTGAGPHGGGPNSSEKQVRVENFREGDLGITLRETPTHPKDPDETGSIKTSPLVLDLDGNGVTTVGLDRSQAYFDQDLDGIPELTGWISRTDGFLALDRNGNGVVDSRSELFGYSAYDINKRFQGDSGFARLAELDGNKDKVIDARDAAFSDLRVWIDADGNGVSDAREMHGLAELGIASVSLEWQGVGQYLADGNFISDTGTFAWADGRTGGVADVWFAYDSASTQAPPGTAVTDPAILALPDLPGNGKVQSLHAAMAADPALRAMVERLGTEASGGMAHFSQDVQAILLRWTGGDQVGKLSRGGYVDGQALEALERWYGRDFLQNQIESNPRPQASAVLLNAWQSLVGHIATDLLIQTDLGKSLLPGVTFEGGAFVVVPDGFTVRAFVEALAAAAPADVADALSYWASALPVIGYLGKGHGTAGAAAAFDAAMAAAGIPLAFSEVDPTDPRRFVVSADPAGGTLLGRQVDGSDELGLNSGDDVLIAGRGNDLLMGRAGSDVYVQTRHGGHDVITESPAANDSKDDYAWIATGDRNVIRFVDDTRASDLSATRSGDDLLLTFAGVGDSSIRVTGYFGSRPGAIAGVVFSDGSSIDAGDLAAMASPATGGDDVVFGFGPGKVLDAGAGNDDYIDGPGRQTYAFGFDSGHDRMFAYRAVSFFYGGNEDTNAVRFKEGVTLADVSFTREGDNLILTLRGGRDTLALHDFFPLLDPNTWSFAPGADTFEFADGTKLSVADIVAALNRPTAGGDVLWGDDTRPTVLDGGAGNDELHGGIDRDTYVFGPGYGQDVVYAGRGGLSDTVRIDGVSIEGLTFTRGGPGFNDLVVSIAGTQDRLTVFNALGSSPVGLFVIDGVQYLANQIEDRILVPTGTPGDDVIPGGPNADRMDGGPGDDVLMGYGGADTYVFGAGYGHDTITDGDGLSTVEFLPGVLPADLRYVRSSPQSTDLRIELPSGDSLTITNFLTYGGDAYRFAFGDGTVLDMAALKVVMTTGGKGDDVLVGFNDESLPIDGGAGDDTVYSDARDLVLFGPGGGHDLVEGTGTVVLAPGLTVADLDFANDGQHLTATIRATGDSITFMPPRYGFVGEGFARVGVVLRFADGTRLDGDDVADLALAQARTDGDDLLVVGSRGGVADGGKGDDVIIARDNFENGVTFVLGRDYGHDVVKPWSGLGTVRFVDGITRADLTVGHDGTDLVLRAGGSTMVLEEYLQSRSRLDAVEFSDGTRMTPQELQDLVLLAPSDGDDVLRGGDGIVADGGKGDDTYLSKGSGGTYVFGRGYGHDVIVRDIYDGGYNSGGFHVLIKAGTTPDDLVYSYGMSTVKGAYGTIMQPTLILRIKGTDDSLELPTGSVADVTFEDGGTVHTSRDIGQAVADASVTDGGGVVPGSFLDETLRGGAGDDILRGYGGNDTYVVGRDDGDDVVANSGRQGTLHLVDAARSDVTFSFGAPGPHQYDVLIHVAGTGQVVTIAGHVGPYGLGDGALGRVLFADGTAMDADAIVDAARAEGVTDGDDYVLGTDGIDVALDGGKGDDLLEGRYELDTYLFGKGSGHDTILDSGYSPSANYGDGANVVRIGPGIVRGDLSFSRGGADHSDLVVTLPTGDSLTIEGQYATDDYYVADLILADGTKVSAREIDAALNVPTAGNDVLVGTPGQDTLDGAAGDDVLAGRSGADTYVFGKGYGNDTVDETGGADRMPDTRDVVVIKDMALLDFDLVRTGTNLDDLAFRSRAGGDVLTIRHFFTPTGTDYTGATSWGVDAVTFGDGSTLERSALAKLVTAVDASGDNVIETGPSGGVLAGGAGSNVLNGGQGDDTYLVGLDGNVDLVQDLGGTDTVVLGAGIAPQSVSFTAFRDESGELRDLLVQVDAGPGLTFRISGQFDAFSNGRIEAFRFADGTSLTWQEAAAQAFEFLATERADVISYAGTGLHGARIEGLKGADTLSGTDGGDTYVWSAGDGNDVLTDVADGRRLEADTLQIQGVSRSQVQFTRSGNDLLVHVETTGEVLTVKGQFSGASTGIERFAFGDGTSVAWDALIPPAIRGDGGPVAGTPGLDDIVGTDGGEAIAGNGGGKASMGTGDRIDGRGGDDTLSGGAGADTMLGGDGNDVISAGTGDKAYGQAGDDVILAVGSPASALLDGGEGFDVVRVGPGPTASFERTALAGIERVEVMDRGSADLSGATADAGLDIVLRSLEGGTAAVRGTDGSDVIVGGLGLDVVLGGGGDDAVRLGPGGGVVDYASSADASRPQSLDIRGGTGSDAVSVVLDGRADRLDGGAGTDRLTLSVGAGYAGKVGLDLSAPSSTLADGTVVRGFESVEFRGGARGDAVKGGDLGDDIRGGSGDDDFDGGAGTDLLAGGGGVNHLRGGAGADTFVLTAAGVAVVEDFRPGVDRIALEGLAVEDLVTGASPLGHGRAGVPTLFYVSGTGDLYYAADGSAGTATLLAHLRGTPALTGGDVIPAWSDEGAGSAPVSTVADASLPDPLQPASAGLAHEWRPGDGDVALSLDTDGTPRLDALALHGVDPATVTVARAGDGLGMTLTFPGGSVTVPGQFDGTGAAYVATVSFDDGTILSAPRLASMADAAGPHTEPTPDGMFIGDGGATAAQVIDAAPGDHLILAGNLSDTVLWGRGDGYDQFGGQLTPNGGHNARGDTLALKGLNPGDVTLSVVAGSLGVDLVVTIRDTGETFTVLGQFDGATAYAPGTQARPGLDAVTDHGGSLGIEFLAFADGTTWDAHDILLHASYGPGPSGVVDAGPGLATMPVVSASRGDQVLLGRPDLADTYVYAAGDGHDALLDDAGTAGVADTLRMVGIDPSRVTGAIMGRDVVLALSDGSGSVRLVGQAHGDGAGVERVVFDDGTTWDAAALLAFPTLGTPLGDTISVSRDADVTAGAGDDLVVATGGDVVIHFAAGDGHDTLRASPADDGTRTLSLDGLSPGAVLLVRAAAEGDPTGELSDLVVVVLATGDTVRVEGQFSGRGIDAIRFEGGLILDAAAIGIAAAAPTRVRDAGFSFESDAGVATLPLADLLGAAGDAGATVDAVLDVVGGSAVLADGAIVFTRENAGGHAGASWVTYTGHTSDGTAFTARASLGFEAGVPAAPPVAVGDRASASPGVPAERDAATGLLANDAGTGTLRVVASEGADASPGTPVVGAYGTLTVAADGSYAYVPGAAANGIPRGTEAVDAFTYAVTDATGLVSVARLEIVVTGANHAPVASPASAAGTEDTTVRGTLPRATEVDGDAVTYHLVEGSARHGSVVIDAATGDYAFTPDRDWNGPASFSYVASDGTMSSQPAGVTLTIAAANDAPTASAVVESFQTDEDATVRGTLAVGTDVDGDAVTYRLVEGSAQHGTVTLDAATGAFALTPDRDWNGPATFSYVVTDGVLSSAPKVVTVAVAPVNDAPSTLPGDETGQGPRDAILKGTLLGGTDPDGDGLTFRLVEGSAAHGTVTVDAATGAYAFTPDADFAGTTTFSYVVSDGKLSSEPKTVTLTFDPVNHAPVAAVAAETGRGGEDAVLRGTLLAGTDADGDGLSFHVVEGSARNGTVEIDAATGAYAFTPDKDYDGPATFSYVVTDGTLSSAPKAVSLTLDPVNDAPVAAAAAESFRGAEDQPLKGTLSAGSDVDGDAITFRLVDGSAAHGSVTLDAATGAFTFTPDKDWNGTTGFSYVVNDGKADSAPKPVSLTLDPVEDAPVAATGTEEFRGSEDTVIKGTLLKGSDADGGTLAFKLVEGSAQHGTVVLDEGTGAFAFTPDKDHHGPAAFSYVVTDGTLSSRPKVVSLTLDPVNDAPVTAAVEGIAKGPQDAVMRGTLPKGSDVDGDALAFAVVPGSASHGTVQLDFVSGEWSFTPAAGYVGPASFAYTVSDGTLTSEPRSVALAFEHVNHAPSASATPESAMGPRDAVIRGTLAAGTDPDGDALTFALVAGSAAHGTVEIDAATGAWAFTPAAGYVGSASFAYTVMDGTLSSSPKTVSLTLSPVNHAPATAAAIEASRGPQDAVVVGRLLAGTDADGDALRFAAVAGSAKHGTVEIDPETGIYAFRPEAGYVGPASFEYTVSDGSLSSAPKAVAVTLDHVNHAPTAASAPERVAGPQDKSIAGHLLAGHDPDGDAIGYRLVEGSATHGSVSLTEEGTFLFTPEAGYVGTATFSYVVSDGELTSAAKTVELALSHVNHAPVAVADDAGHVLAGKAKTIAAATLLANDSDPDGDALSLAGVRDAVGGTVSLDRSGNVVFTAASGFSGAGGFSYDVSDGHGGVGTAHVSVSVDKPGSNVIVAGPNQVLILGTSGDDEFHLSPGAAVVVGGGGTDTFVFPERFGPVIITDFRAGGGPGHDVLDVSALGIHDMSELMAVVRSGTPFGIGITLLDVPGHGALMLNGVKASSLTPDDFHFAPR